VIPKVPAHKFHLGQAVGFNPPRGIYAPRGPYVVTAKLPGLDGVFEYRIRGPGEMHERMARENELSAIPVEDKPPEIEHAPRIVRPRPRKRGDNSSTLSGLAPGFCICGRLIVALACSWRLALPARLPDAPGS
jgi:hypothetical protein